MTGLDAGQQQILRVVADLDPSGEFALAGGGAMNVHGISDRRTRDLDFFTPERERVQEMAGRLADVLREDGRRVERTRDAPGFVQMIIDDETVVEFAEDARWLDPVVTELGWALDTRELAADKMLALFGRTEARDIVDVARLRERYELTDMTAWATEKDPGFDAGITIEMLTQPGRFDLSGLDVTPSEFDAIHADLVAALEALLPPL